MNVSGISGSFPMGAPPAGGQHNPMKTALDAVADKLGISGKDLGNALRSGTTLADFAAQKGMSRDDLVATVKSALSNSASQMPAPPDGASAPSIDEIATALVDGVGPKHGVGPSTAAGFDAGAFQGFASATDSGGIAFKLPKGGDGYTYC